MSRPARCGTFPAQEKAHRNGRNSPQGLDGKHTTSPLSRLTKSLSLFASTNDDLPLPGALVTGNLLPCLSGPAGAFAVPCLIPEPIQKLSLLGERRDLGLSGRLDVDVPSTGQVLRLATVPFAIQTILPGEGAEVAPGSHATVALTAPADPATLDQVKLFVEANSNPSYRSKPIPSKTVSKTKGAKSAAKPSKAKPRAKAQAKSAMQLQTDVPALVEIPLRRTLSLDGRTLLLIPERPLMAGEKLHLRVEGLKGLNGELAATQERAFRVTAVALPKPVDFARIKLSYPDDAFNVTVTIPELAIPGRARLNLEAPGMGSTFTGSMPPTGPLAIPFKASLGERLKLTVQLETGETLTGFLSRYESTDGSGRVTVGVDGGRVEAVDGSCAANFPEGALESPAEIQIEFLTEHPAELDPSLIPGGAKIAGRVRLSSSQEVAIKKRPILEITKPENSSAAQHTDGLGAYAIFDRVEGFEEDGSPCVYFELSDTAALSGNKLISFGGLPESPSVPVEAEAAFQGILAPSSALNTAMGEGRVIRLSNSAAGATKMHSYGGKESLRNAPVEEKNFMFGGLLGLFFLDAFMIDAGPHYISGFADIQVPGQERKPAIGAFIYFSKTGGIKRSGQMLGRTTGAAASYIFASFLTDELVRGGGEVMGIDKDYGTRAFSGTSFGGPGGIFGTYYHVPTLHFQVDQTKIEDHQAPFVSLRFMSKPSSGNTTEAGLTVPAGQTLWAEISAGDDRDGDRIADPKSKGELSVLVDGTKTAFGNETGKLKKASTGNWRIDLAPGGQKLGPGRHTLEVYARDTSGNESRTKKEIDLLDFRAGEPGNGPLDADVYPEPDPDRAALDRPIQIVFTKNVTIPGPSLITLVSSTGVPVSFFAVGPNGNISATTVARMLYVVPSPSLTYGMTYTLTLSAGITGAGTGEALAHHVFTFTTTQIQGQESWNLNFKPGKIAALGNRLFIEDRDDRCMTAVVIPSNGADSVEVKDLITLGGKDFLGQDIVGVRAFSCVPIGGGALQDMLMVTTSPRAGDNNRQSVLWAFRATGDCGLIFAMSIGIGSSGYSPNLDCRDGILAVGRLSSSVLLIDVAKAISEWNKLMDSEKGMVREPGGATQKAIIQPFYITDPEATCVPTHWGVALVPNLDQSGPFSELDVSVGTTAPGIMWSANEPLSGMPTYQYTYVPGVPQDPRPPFENDASHGGANKNVWPGVVKKPVPTGTTGPDGFAAKKQATWARASIRNWDGASRTTNLVVGVSLMSPLTSASGNSLVVMDEQLPFRPFQLGVWPDPKIPLDPSRPRGIEEPPFGSGAAYEIAHQMPQIDPSTGFCAVQVLRTGTAGGGAWFVVDLNTPTAPKTLVKLDGAYGWSAMSQGVLYQTGGGGQNGGVIRVAKLNDVKTVAVPCGADPCEGQPFTTLEDTRRMTLNDDPCTPLSTLDCVGRRLDDPYHTWVSGGRRGDEPVDREGWTPAMKTAMNEFSRRLATRGLEIRVTSAYRSPSYQLHLKEIQRKWLNYNENRAGYDRRCPELTAELRRQVGIHGTPQRVADPTASNTNPPHCGGRAADINIRNSHGVIIANEANGDGYNQFEVDWVASGLRHPSPGSDDVHFQLR